MNDASLDHRLGEHCRDGIGKALQAVDHGNEDIGDAPVLEFVHDAHPEPGPFGLLDPDAQDLLGAVRLDAKRDIKRFALSLSLFGIPDAGDL